MRPLLVVKLDNPMYGAGPGVVVAIVEDVRDYFELTDDRRGHYRLWEGDFQIGQRVKMGELQDRGHA